MRVNLSVLALGLLSVALAEQSPSTAVAGQYESGVAPIAVVVIAIAVAVLLLSVVVLVVAHLIGSTRK